MPEQYAQVIVDTPAVLIIKRLKINNVIDDKYYRAVSSQLMLLVCFTNLYSLRQKAVVDNQYKLKTHLA